MFKFLSNFMLFAEEKISNVSNNILGVGIFKKREIKKILTIVGRVLKDPKLFEKYNNGKIRCATCKKIIGPKSKENRILGAVIPFKNKIKLVCQDLGCYDKSLK